MHMSSLVSLTVVIPQRYHFSCRLTQICSLFVNFVIAIIKNFNNLVALLINIRIEVIYFVFFHQKCCHYL